MTELLLEDSVLLAEVLDDRILLAADPASEGGNKDLPGLKDGGHPSIVARKLSIRQLSLAVQVGLLFPRIGSAELLDTTRSRAMIYSALNQVSREHKQDVRDAVESSEKRFDEFRGITDLSTADERLNELRSALRMPEKPS